MRRPQLNANQLKLIAIAAMTVDHVAEVLLPPSLPWFWVMRLIGRLTAPIMCFFIAEGYFHTSNLKRYMGRLLLVAAVSHIPYNLCVGYSWQNMWHVSDVLWTLLLGLCALAVYRGTLHPAAKLFLVFACCWLAQPLDWNYLGVLWVLAFGVFHGERKKQMLAFCAAGCLYLFQALLWQSSTPFPSRFGVFLAVPLLLLYNGRLGRRSRLLQWGYYWYYPAHLTVLFLIRLALYGG